MRIGYINVGAPLRLHSPMARFGPLAAPLLAKPEPPPLRQPLPTEHVAMLKPPPEMTALPRR